MAMSLNASQKLKIWIIKIIKVVFFLFLSPTLFAQSFFNAPPPKSMETSTPAANATTLSPKDFRNRVNDLNKKTEHRLLEKVPKPSPIAPPSNKYQPPAQQAPPPATSTQKENSSVPATIEHKIAAPLPEVPPIRIPQTSPPPAAVVPPASTPPYTGFGNQKNESSPQDPKGWNIKY